MSYRRLFTVAAVLALALPFYLIVNHLAWADSNSSQTEDQQKMEKNFFKEAASGNTLEIRLAKLAQERSDDAQVKQTAQMIQHDHEQANQLLKRTASEHHIDVSLDDLTPVDQAVFDDLQKKQGEEFTHCYVFQQTGNHLQCELFFAYHANKGQSDVCRQYSAQVLPTIQKHLHALEQIARPMAGLSGEAETAGEKVAPEAR